MKAAGTRARCFYFLPLGKIDYLPDHFVLLYLFYWAKKKRGLYRARVS